MVNIRSENRRWAEEHRFGHCPVCNEVLAWVDSSLFCPFEAAIHPEIASRLECVWMAPTADRHDYWIKATSADGTRAAFVLEIGGSLAATSWSRDAPINELAERLARSLIAAGARGGEFRFTGNNSGQTFGETLSLIRAEGAEFFRPPETTQVSPF